MTFDCFKCRTPLPDNARFCSVCGTDVSKDHSHETTQSMDPGADLELMRRLQSEVGNEYVIERELGRGGMAIVYLGHDSQLGRKVAVKLLPPELTFGTGTQVVDRFRREARTSATLDHANIIPVYRVSQSGKLIWYVMKYVEGESLDKVLVRQGQLPLAQCTGIVRQVADALDFAHVNDVIHRDVKPANIIVDARGRVTVTDFGIAKAVGADTLTATGAMIGTPYFMSPEQCSGMEVTPASDQYSLAVMTYLMLAGHLPFSGESTFEIVRQHVMEPVPPIETLRPSLPPEVVDVVERGLSKRGDERFENCTEFASALTEACDKAIAVPSIPPRMSETLRIRPVGEVAATEPASRRPSRVSTKVIPPAVDRKPRPVIVAATRSSRRWFVVAALFVAGGGAWAAYSAGWIGGTMPVGTPTAEGTPTGTDSEPSPLTNTDSVAAIEDRPESSKQVAVDSDKAGPTGVPPANSQRGTTRPSAETERRDVAPIAAAPPARDIRPPAPVPKALIRVGSRPISAIEINGQPTGQNPVMDFEVPVGPVVITFTVTDSTGVWSDTLRATVTSGLNNLRTRVLRRPGTP